MISKMVTLPALLIFSKVVMLQQAANPRHGDLLSIYCGAQGAKMAPADLPADQAGEHSSG